WRLAVHARLFTTRRTSCRPCASGKKYLHRGIFSPLGGDRSLTRCGDSRDACGLSGHGRKRTLPAMPPPTISEVIALPVPGGFFADDQAAIKAGAARDGLAYPPGVRSPSEAVSVLLVLSDGYVAHGDCVSVQYAGVGGREPRLDADALAATFR